MTVDGSIRRTPELDRIDRALTNVNVESSRLVLEGAPGSGKTTLVTAAVRIAAAAGISTIVARPSQSERSLPFGALDSLLGALVEDDTVRVALDDRAATVLDVALGRQPATNEALLPHELGVAVLSLLESAVDGGALLIVVDDHQWIDAASRDVLDFVSRRLPSGGICLLIATRPDEDPPVGERWPLTPLDETAAAALARAVSSTPLQPHVIDRVVEVSGGNPLFVIELAKIAGAATAEPGRPVPLPRSLRSLVADRFRSLPQSTVVALAAMSLLARPTAEVMEALGMLDDLGPAELDGIVELRNRQLAFSHPVLAAAAYDAVPATRRLALHRRLAEVTDGIERCLHLAHGAIGPDSAIAAELTAVADTEARRGATVEAAELAVLALDLSPPDDAARVKRLMLAGDLLFRAGRTEEAATALQRVRTLAADTDTAATARSLLALATIEYSRSDNTELATELARQALTATDDPSLQAEAHAILSLTHYTDFAAAADHAGAALDIVRRLPHPSKTAVAQAISASALARFHAGFGLDRAAFDEAIALEHGARIVESDSAFAALAAALKYADQLDEAESMFLDLAGRSDPGSLPYALSHLPQMYLWAGRWDEAQHAAARHLALAEETGQESQVFTARFNLAMVAAYRGELDDATVLGRQLYEQGRDTGVPWTERNGVGLLAFIAMTTGDMAEAIGYFARNDELCESMNLHEPGFRRYQGDFVEVLVNVGEIDRAKQLLGTMLERGTRLGRPSMLAAAHRGVALVAATDGDRDAAVAAAEQAKAVLDGTSLEYDRARNALTLGMIFRRFKERSSARTTLDDALLRFERMGAVRFVERVERELGRVGGRAPKSVSSALTATELRVAELAAAGRTTRRIADELFISVKTVEANLTRVYRKLDVTNRALLANRLSSIIP